MPKPSDRKAAPNFLKKAMRRYGSPKVLVTDRLRSYGAALRTLGASDLLQSGRYLNNRAENSSLPLRRRERAMLRFRRMLSLETFAAAHSSVHNHFNQKRRLYSRDNFKLNRVPALAEWRQLGAA
jgi:putative transposase